MCAGVQQSVLVVPSRDCQQDSMVGIEGCDVLEVDPFHKDHFISVMGLCAWELIVFGWFLYCFGLFLACSGCCFFNFP